MLRYWENIKFLLGLLKDHSGKVVAIIQLINKKVGGVGEPDEVGEIFWNLF